MSGSNLNLEAHWALAEINSGRVLDSSGKDRHGSLSGDPAIVADDQFGACLLFDGSNDAIEFTTVSDLDLAGADFTIEAWLNCSSFSPGDNTILGMAATSEDNMALFASVRNGQPYFGFCTPDPVTTTALSVETWYHLAWRYDHSLNELKTYINGVADVTNTCAGLSPAGGYLRLGLGNANSYFHGRMSHVRIYSRALSDTEIKADMALDRAALATYRMTHPLEFSLADDDDQQTLYITDAGDSRSINLELRNIVAGQVELLDLGAIPASSEYYHVALHFRPGLLSGASQAAIALDSSVSGWNCFHQLHASGAFSLYLLHTSQAVLDTGDLVKLILTGINVEPSGGARSTRVLFRYKNIVGPAAGDPLSGRQSQHLNIAGQRGKRLAPLHIGFVGSNTILNDGQSTNSLNLRLSNTDLVSALALNPIGSAAPTTLTLFFDVGDISKEWALASADDVTHVAAQVIKPDGTPDADWTTNVIAASELGERPGWSFTTAATEIAASGFIQIRIDEIVTGHPSGPTNLYLHYENLPGYWDGQLAAPIEKSPLLVHDDAAARMVGIGAAPPTGKLEINNTLGDALKFGDQAGGKVHHLSSNRELVLGALNSDIAFREAGYDSLNSFDSRLHLFADRLVVSSGDVMSSGALRGGELLLYTGTNSKNIQTGLVDVGANLGAVSKSIQVFFPNPFSIRPHVFATALSESDNDNTYVVTARDVNETYFGLEICRLDLLLDDSNVLPPYEWTEGLKVYWLAVEK